MAIYSMHVSNVSRGAGQSSLASLSYITSERVRDERLGVTYNGFGRRERVVGSGTLLPAGAPDGYADPGVLFNALEAAERAANARTAKKVMVALPRELDAARRREAVEAFIRDQVTSRGYAATYAIHEDRDGLNPHAHILVANRRIDPRTGRWAAKRRMEYVLDQEGRRVPVIDARTGLQKTDKRNRRQWKRRSVESNPLDDKRTLQGMREAWASECNRLLPQESHIDHRSLAAQGVDRIPTTHEGYAARAIERRGGVADRCEDNRAIRADNRLLETLRAQAAELMRTLRRLAERIRSLAARLEKAREAVGRRRVEQANDRVGRARRSLEEGRGRLAANPSRCEEWRRVEAVIAPATGAVWDADHAGIAHPLERHRLRKQAQQAVTTANDTLRDQFPWMPENVRVQASSGPEQDAMRRRAMDAATAHALRPLERDLEDAELELERARSTPAPRGEVEREAERLLRATEESTRRVEMANPRTANEMLRADRDRARAGQHGTGRAPYGLQPWRRAHGHDGGIGR